MKTSEQIMEFADWVYTIERVIFTSITDCDPRSWQEDHITYSWIKNIRSKSKSVSLKYLPRPISIAWDIYKAVGVTEISHGDVAILVKMTLPNRRELMGVAFLEAKRSYDSGAFDGIDWNQLKRQYVNSSSHKLLLYDQKDVPFSFEQLLPLHLPYLYPILDPQLEYYYFRYKHFLQDPLFVTRATVLSTPEAFALREKTCTSLYQLAVPLSYQLCCRYLLGYDLDHRIQHVAEVQSGVANGIDYLFVGHVVLGEAGEASVQSVSFDSSTFRPLAEDGE